MKTFRQFIIEADQKDTITFDIPLLIRILEYAREDIKSDPELHKVVEKLIDIRDKGTLTMDDYNLIVKLKEEYIEEMAAGAVGGGSAGPTMTAGSGAVAGIGQPPGSKQGEPGVNMKKRKKVLLFNKNFTRK